MRVTYLTAGSAGMYCGSCMHDNTLARALLELGVDVQLVPMYTPIRTDESDVTVDRVFFGGINVYLQQHFRVFRHLPASIDRFLDGRRLLNWIGARGIETSADRLGDLALSMLRGASGFQRKEVRRLCRWLGQPPRPDIVNLSNVLIAGSVPELKRRLDVPVLVTLQGDDVFLDALPTRDKSRAIGEIQRLAESVDAFLVHSRFYADYMADYLSLDRRKFRFVPLGIDTSDFGSLASETVAAGRDESDRPRVGYLARLAPEKGLHLLVDAFLVLKKMPGMESVELVVAGWLGKRHAAYVEAQFEKVRAAGWGSCFRYVGSVDRKDKIAFLKSLDVFSVPAEYAEPKGLYVLEAMAAGVAVVQPAHGAFPELLKATGGGRLVPAGDAAALADAIHALLCDERGRRELGRVGREAVHRSFNAQAMARGTLAVLRQFAGQGERGLHRAERPEPHGRGSEQE
ncbi:MAG: glycosyltransferase family 4 protein [Planctomycetes bacterium]|nr:glycosyltransferase family 4 protein [Planctomycetota bacterium]